MTVQIAFALGALCGVLIVVAALLVTALWSDHVTADRLVDRIRAEAQLDHLTAQTLAAMRDAARRAGGEQL